MPWGDQIGAKLEQPWVGKAISRSPLPFGWIRWTSEEALDVGSLPEKAIQFASGDHWAEVGLMPAGVLIWRSPLPSMFAF